MDSVTRFNAYRAGVGIPVLLGAATMATWGVTEWAARTTDKDGRVPWYVVIVGSAGIVTAGVVGARVGIYAGSRVAAAMA